MNSKINISQKTYNQALAADAKSRAAEARLGVTKKEYNDCMAL